MADKNKPKNLNLASKRNNVILKSSFTKKKYHVRVLSMCYANQPGMEHCHEVVAQQPQKKASLIFKTLNSSLILH